MPTDGQSYIGRRKQTTSLEKSVLSEVCWSDLLSECLLERDEKFLKKKQD